jgi:gas vesicle protein/vacuolar-type H+-ATPase subunit F/Vma7
MELPKMLAYILAIALGTGSIGLYLAAFITPKIHRKDDFLWAGLGLFYALVLWVCASRFTGGVLLGQTAAVLLLLSFGWQTVKLRGAIANPEKLTELAEFSVTESIKNLFKGKPKVTIPSAETVTDRVAEAVETAKETVAGVKEEVTDKIADTVDKVTEKAEELKETVKENIAETIPTPTDIDNKEKKKSGFSLAGIFNKSKVDRPKTETKSSAKPIFEAEEEELKELPQKSTEMVREEITREIAKSEEKVIDKVPEKIEQKEPEQREEKPEKLPEKEKSDAAEVIIAEVVKTGETPTGNIKTEMKAVLENTSDKIKKAADTDKAIDRVEESIEENPNNPAE